LSFVLIFEANLSTFLRLGPLIIKDVKDWCELIWRDRLRIFNYSLPTVSSSAHAEGSCNVLRQLKSCHLLYNCTKNRTWKRLE